MLLPLPHLASCDTHLASCRRELFNLGDQTCEAAHEAMQYAIAQQREEGSTNASPAPTPPPGGGGKGAKGAAARAAAPPPFNQEVYKERLHEQARVQVSTVLGGLRGKVEELRSDAWQLLDQQAQEAACSTAECHQQQAAGGSGGEAADAAAMSKRLLSLTWRHFSLLRAKAYLGGNE